MMFTCDKCGECCRHVNLSPLYQHLDRGDGICKYLQGNLCGIYDARPLLCQVNESYEAFFKGIMTREEYNRANSVNCKKLKQMRK